MIIKDHKLEGDKVTYQGSPNFGAKFDNNDLDTIIIHYTAGSSAESSVRTLCNPDSKSSAHLVIGRNGSIFQLVPFDTISWHAGKSSYSGRHGFNKYSIGIEIDNAGKLSHSGDKYVSWFGKNYKENEALKAIHKNETESGYWHIYNEIQLSLVQEICSLLISNYGIKSILGHDEVSPGRKIDPGPAFPIDKIREHLLFSDRSSDRPIEVPINKNQGIITASKLNCRSEPYISSKIVREPLSKGDIVEILHESDGWYKIESKIYVWVKKDYVKTIK